MRNLERKESRFQNKILARSAAENGQEELAMKHYQRRFRFSFFTSLLFSSFFPLSFPFLLLIYFFYPQKVIFFYWFWVNYVVRFIFYFLNFWSIFVNFWQSSVRMILFFRKKVSKRKYNKNNNYAGMIFHLVARAKLSVSNCLSSDVNQSIKL